MNTQTCFSRIDTVVSAAYGLTAADLKEDTHRRQITWPRQVAMFLDREIAKAKWRDIGRHFGRKIGGAFWGWSAVRDLMDVDPEVRKEVEALKAKCSK